MFFPNELVLAIIKHLGRAHLKSARLVCKTWCSYASPILFDTIYVAPNRLDLQVFKDITQHPILSKCVRRLVYDGSEFIPGLTKQGYIRGLWAQTNLMFETCKPGLDSPDPRINDWAYDVVVRNLSAPETVAKWKDDGFISDGYREYSKHSLYQQKTLRSGDFIESLVQGLSRLVCLESVTLEGGWPCSVRTSLREHHHGTPLARRWNPFHCCPHPWNWEPEDHAVEDLPNGLRHYRTIVAALVRAQRHIDEFAVGTNCSPERCSDAFFSNEPVRVDPFGLGDGASYVPGIPPVVFQKNDPVRRSTLGLDIAAFAGLKRFHLRLASCRDVHGGESASAPAFCDDIQGLPKLLGSMRSLRRLHLDLSYSSEDPATLFACDQVFPPATKWRDLEEFAVDNLASRATDLLRLLLVQMPRLNHVELGTTQLLDGGWESAIECLKQFGRFTTFVIGRDATLSHFWNGDFECIYGEIDRYVLQGGRHPCLAEHQPASASEAYMLDIEPFLRDCLLGILSPL